MSKITASLLFLTWLQVYASQPIHIHEKETKLRRRHLISFGAFNELLSPETARDGSPPTLAPLTSTASRTEERTTSAPTVSPTSLPTKTPTNLPTSKPTTLESISPTSLPTKTPTNLPTSKPTTLESISPTSLPTKTPTNLPTSKPTTLESISPTMLPTKNPINLPTGTPTTLESVTLSASLPETTAAAPTVSPVENRSNSPSSSTSEPTTSPITLPVRSSPTTIEGPSFSSSAKPTPQHGVGSTRTSSFFLEIKGGTYSKEGTFDSICDITQTHINEITKRSFGKNTVTTVDCNVSNGQVQATTTTEFPNNILAPDAISYDDYIQVVMTSDETISTLPTEISQASSSLGMDKEVKASVDTSVHPPVILLSFEDLHDSAATSRSPFAVGVVFLLYLLLE